MRWLIGLKRVVIASTSTDVMSTPDISYREFPARRAGMIHAMDGGLWMHRHVWKGRPMAHLVSADRARLLAYGASNGISVDRLQFKPLKDPRTGVRRDAWHWDLGGPFLPPPLRQDLGVQVQEAFDVSES